MHWHSFSSFVLRLECVYQFLEEVCCCFYLVFLDPDPKMWWATLFSFTIYSVIFFILTFTDVSLFLLLDSWGHFKSEFPTFMNPKAFSPVSCSLLKHNFQVRKPTEPLLAKQLFFFFLNSCLFIVQSPRSFPLYNCLLSSVF